jgi:Transposase
MTKRKYSEVEMIGALKQMEAGRSAAEVGRELGVSKHTVSASSLGWPSFTASPQVYSGGTDNVIESACLPLCE